MSSSSKDDFSNLHATSALTAGRDRQITIRRFGPAQARAYEYHLVERAYMLAEGSPPYGRSCSVLMDVDADAGDLRFVLVLAPGSRRGHYVIFRERNEWLEILDFLSTDFGLLRHLKGLQRV